MYRTSDEQAPVFPNEADPAFLRDVLAGLRAAPKSIPARWFYDLTGSRLFEEITALPEYYPTRTERSILSVAAEAIGERVGAGRAVVEFGSGSSAKTPLLLRAISPAAYVPIDISGEFLREAAADLRRRLPGLPVHELEGDFTRPLELPAAIDGLPRIGFFPGSTIGNLEPAEATDLLRTMAATLGEGAVLLIGMDRAKPEEILIPAYDDAQGVTARFNLNLLKRINRELLGSIPVDAFRHLVRWDAGQSRIEMHLEASETLCFTVAGEKFAMERGETIHTENSTKYGPAEARLLLRAGGWSPIAEWTDERDYFSLILAEARAPTPHP